MLTFFGQIDQYDVMKRPLYLDFVNTSPNIRNSASNQFRKSLLYVIPHTGQPTKAYSSTPSRVLRRHFCAHRDRLKQTQRRRYKSRIHAKNTTLTYKSVFYERSKETSSVMSIDYRNKISQLRPVKSPLCHAANHYFTFYAHIKCQCTRWVTDYIEKRHCKCKLHGPRSGLIRSPLNPYYECQRSLFHRDAALHTA